MPRLLVRLAIAALCLPAAGAPMQAVASGTDGAWHEVVPPPREYHCSVYDPLRQRMVVIGGQLENPLGVWTLSLGSSLQWAFVPTTGREPAPPDGGAWNPQTYFTGMAAIYDPVRDRILIEGTDYLDGSFNPEVTWALSMSSMTWTRLSPPGTRPPFRQGHTAIYDPVRDRMVIFAGAPNLNDNPTNDVWALSLSGIPTWTQLLPAGTPPPPRQQHVAVYDPVRDRMVVFGGQDYSSGLNERNDIWALSLAGAPSWTQLLPSGTLPAGSHGMGAVYDALRDRMLITGGASSTGGGNRSQTWSLDFPTVQWTRLLSTGGPLGGSTSILDPANDRVVTYGGENQATLLTLSLSSALVWTHLSPGFFAPGPYYDAALTYSPADSFALLTGGGSLNTDYYPAAFDNHVQGFSLKVGYWSIYDFSLSQRPPPRIDHSAIVDPTRNALIVFGGFDESGPFNDVWRMTLSPKAWTQWLPAGTPPSHRAGHSAIHDPAGDRMLVFGGYDGTQCVNDVWALSLGTPQWSPLTPSGSPPPARANAAAIRDPLGNRMLVFGGYNGALHFGRSGTPYNDLWALNLTGAPAWTALAPLGTPPPPSFDPIAVYDPDRVRVEVLTNAGVWALYLSDPPVWQKLDIANAVVGGIERGSAIYDVVKHRVLLYPYGNWALWSLDFPDNPTAVEISLVDASANGSRAHIEWRVREAATATVERAVPGGAWAEQEAVTVDAGGRVVFEDADVTAGQRYGYRLAIRDGAELRTGGEAWLTIPVDELSLRGAVPNPAAAGPLSIAFTLAGSDAARLSLYDVAGREIASREVGALGPGPHVVQLASRARPGIYLVRLASAARVLNARVAVMR